MELCQSTAECRGLNVRTVGPSTRAVSTSLTGSNITALGVCRALGSAPAVAKENQWRSLTRTRRGSRVDAETAGAITNASTTTLLNGSQGSSRDANAVCSASVAIRLRASLLTVVTKADCFRGAGAAAATSAYPLHEPDTRQGRWAENVGRALADGDEERSNLSFSLGVDGLGSWYMVPSR